MTDSTLENEILFGPSTGVNVTLDKTTTRNQWAVVCSNMEDEEGFLRPLTKTGFHSARLMFSDIDAVGSVVDAVRRYITASQTIPRSECLQGELF